MTDAARGEIYLRLAESGLSYDQIGAKYGITRQSVGSRISEYRKKMGIAVPKRSKKIKETREPKRRGRKLLSGRERVDGGYEDRRAADMALAYRRPDGVLQCPPRYALGYVNLDQILG